MAKPNMLDAIIAAQKDKNPNASISKGSLEDSLASVDTMSAADFKKLLAGESIQTAAAPASNIIEIAQDIKKLSENSETQVVAESKTIEIIENTNNNIEQINSGIDKMSDIQEDISLSPEEKAEQIALIKDEIEVLQQIESNTRGESIVPKSSYDTGESNQSGMMPGLMGFLGGGLAGGIGGLFAGLGTAAAGSGILAALTGGVKKFIVGIFKGLLKGAFILTIVGSLASGLIDALEEYKESGSIVEALWAGLSGFLEFLSFGLIDKEDIDKLREEVNSYWESFSNALMGFLDSITPDFLKDKKTESGTEVGPIGKFIATKGETVSTLDFESSNKKITGEEIKDNKGDNFYKVSVDGKEYRVSKDTYFSAKGFADGGNKELAASILEERGKIETPQFTDSAPEKIKGTIGDFPVNESAQMNYDMFGNEIISVPEKTTADTVIKQSESNAALKEAIAAPAPVIVNAPTTNTSMQHTTALPQVKPRDYDTPNLLNNYSFP